MSSLPARPVSPPEPRPAASSYLAEIREQPAALRRLLAHARRVRAGRRGGDAGRPPRPDRRPRLLRQRRGVRRLRVRAPPRADGDARLDQPHRLLRREARLSRVDGDRAVAVGPDAGRARVRDRARAARARSRSRSRTTRIPISRARPTRCSRSRPATSSPSPRRRPTRTRSPRSRSSRACSPVAATSSHGQLETVAEQHERQIPLLEQAVASIAVPFASVGRMFVIGRGPEFATAREIALKLLETCKIAAEPLTATDLAHGPIAALDHFFPVWAVATDDETLDVVVEAAARVRAAGATLVASGPAADAIADAQFRLPVPTPPAAAPRAAPVGGRRAALRRRGRPGEGPRPGQAAGTVESDARAVAPRSIPAKSPKDFRRLFSGLSKAFSPRRKSCRMRRTAGKRGERRDHRQPEVERAVGDDAEQRRRERHADPDEREGHHHLDEPGAAGRQRAAGGHVAGGVGEDQRGVEISRVVDLQRRPQAGDVAEPVEARRRRRRARAGAARSAGSAACTIPATA